MTPRASALAAALATLLAGAWGGAARTRASAGIDWPDLPDWGQDLELSDVRHALELQPPVALQRWLYNPRERTALGLDRLRSDGPDAALAPFETAGRIAPDDRAVLFNLGTARLLADHGDAVEALERAVAAADGEGAPHGRPLDPTSLERAYYNLGAARLGGGDAAGAVAAFEDALRRDPSDENAKYNLELALHRLEEERLRLRAPQESPEGDRPGEEETSEESGGTRPESEPESQEDEGGRQTGRNGPEAETRPQDGAAAARRPLAGFEEQADLSAAQAAALLESVENLERRQRRLEAERTAGAATGSEEEDW